MDAIVREIRFALRSLRRNPGFTGAVVLTLALGLGAGTAIFSVLYRVLLEPLPYAEPDRLAMLYTTGPAPRAGGVDTMNWSYPKLRTLREAGPPVESLAAFRPFNANLSGTETPERVAGELVSPAYFRLLGVGAAHGRAFSGDEVGEEEAAPLALLGHGLWLRRFGGDSEVVGRRIRLDGELLTVVGVLPGGFGGLSGSAEVWVPLGMAPALYYEQALEEPFNHWLRVVGRLAPGVGMDAARAGMTEAARRVTEAHGGPIEVAHVGAAVVPLQETRAAAPLRTSLLVLSAAVGFVLLIACLNVANLLLARTSGRRRELAVRAALGAGRGRILRHLLAEGGLLALGGGALGLLLAWWGLTLLASLAPPSASWTAAGVGLGAAAVAFAAALAGVVGLGIGVLPGLRAAGVRVGDVLRSGGRGVAGDAAAVPGRRPWRASVIVQTSLAVVLLVGAGLMVNSLLRLRALDPGLRAEGLLTFRIEPAAEALGPAEERAALKLELMDRLAALPGVQGVAEGQCTPFSARCSASILTRIEGVVEFGEGERPVVGVHRVLPGHFDVLGIPLLRGRDFRRSDRLGSGKVVLVNETFARSLLPGEEPIGKRIHVGQSYFRGDSTAAIVGVVGDVPYGEPGAAVRPAVYVPSLQSPWPAGTWMLRAEIDPAALVPAVRHAVLAARADLPIFDIATMEERIAEASATTRFAAGLLAALALLAALLSAVGIYGIVAWVVARRTRELGVRAALGAGNRELLLLAMREGLVPALCGLALGLAGALALTRAVRSLLFEVGPADPATFAGVAAALAGACLLACYLPARRAAGIDPMTVLREE